MTTSTATTAALPARALSQEDSVYARVSRRIVPLIMLCYVFAYLDRVNVGFAKLQMTQALNFSDTVYGLGAGIFFIGYFLFEVPSNLLLHKIGARVWIARIMITWGLISGAFAFVQTPTQFYVMRFLLGLAEAGFYPGIILYLTYWYPSHRRARIVAMFMAAIPISGIFGNPLSGWIMSAFHDNSGWQGWQWMFAIEAIPAVRYAVSSSTPTVARM
jgi:MFS family permease